MNQSYEQEIDLKWLLYRVLRAWRIIVLVALIAAIVVGGIKFITDYSTFTDEAYLTQQEAAYAEAYSAWEEQTRQIREEIAVLQQSRANQLSYNENSILMQIDPFHEYQASFVVYLDCGDQLLSGRLLQMYHQYMVGGELLTSVCKKLADKPELRYLKEVITISPNYNTQLISCTIKHVNEAHCREIIDLLLEGLQIKKEELVNSIGTHELIIPTPSYVEQLNLSLEKTQKTNEQTLPTLDTRLDELQASLETTAAPKAPVYAPLNRAGMSAVKYLLLTGIIVAFIMAVCIAGLCILSGRLQNPTDISTRFRLRIIGLLPAARVKRPFAFVSRLISSIFGITMTPDDYSKLAKAIGSSIQSEISSREANGTKPSLAFTGTLSEDTMKAVVSAFQLKDGISVIYAPDVLTDADSVDKISSSDYVILLAEQGTTSLSDIEKMLEALKSWNKTVLGAVITNTDAKM